MRTTYRSKAIALLNAVRPYDERLHHRRADALAKILKKHPDARVTECAGARNPCFGERDCRKGRCARIGFTGSVYEVWAVWGDAKGVRVYDAGPTIRLWEARRKEERCQKSI